MGTRHPNCMCYDDECRCVSTDDTGKYTYIKSDVDTITVPIKCKYGLPDHDFQTAHTVNRINEIMDVLAEYNAYLHRVDGEYGYSIQYRSMLHGDVGPVTFKQIVCLKCGVCFDHWTVGEKLLRQKMKKIVKKYKINDERRQKALKLWEENHDKRIS